MAVPAKVTRLVQNEKVLSGAIRLWDNFIAKLRDLLLLAATTSDVDTDMRVGLEHTKIAIERAHNLLGSLLHRDSRIIFFETQYVAAQRAFSLLEHYSSKNDEELRDIAYELEDLRRKRNRL